MTKNSLLTQGIAAVKAGDRDTARRLLTRAVRQNPDSEAAWLWLGTVLRTPQGRSFCLRKALALNPANQTAQRGLEALERAHRAPAIVAQPLPVPLPRLVPLRQVPALGELVRRQWFWRVIVACLSVIAVGLVGVLAYAIIGRSSTAGDGSSAAMVPIPSPAPRYTLRPTFTPIPTHTPTLTPTPTPTCSPISTLTPTFTPSPTPTDAATPTPTFSRRRTEEPPPTPPPGTLPAIPTSRPTLPPRSLDPRLASLGVRVEPASVAPGQAYWRLIEARWADEHEAGGKHDIFVEALDAHGDRAVGQSVIIEWPGGSVTLPVEDRPPPDWGVNFPMYSTLGSYAASMEGGPSDRIVGLGLGTADAPDFTIHTSFYLTFRWVQW